MKTMFLKPTLFSILAIGLLLMASSAFCQNINMKTGYSGQRGISYVKWDIPSDMKWDIPSDMKWDIPSDVKCDIPSYVKWDIPSDVKPDILKISNQGVPVDKLIAYGNGDISRGGFGGEPPEPPKLPLIYYLPYLDDGDDNNNGIPDDQERFLIIDLTPKSSPIEELIRPFLIK